MLFKIEFDVRYVDGSTASATTRPSTEVEFERRFERTLTSVFMEDLPLEHAEAMRAAGPESPLDPEVAAAFTRWFANSMRTEWTYFMAWHAARSGDEFDVWLDRVDEIDWRLVSAARPTRPVAPAS